MYHCILGKILSTSRKRNYEPVLVLNLGWVIRRIHTKLEIRPKIKFSCFLLTIPMRSIVTSPVLRFKDIHDEQTEF